MAGSSRSLRLVMPMSSTLLSSSTPSIFDSSWFTTWSPTPESDVFIPRACTVIFIAPPVQASSPLRTADAAMASTDSTKLVQPRHALRVQG